MRVRAFLFCIGLLFSPAFVSGSENVRVALADNQKSVVVTSRSGFMREGRPFSRVERRLVFSAASAGSRPVRIRASGGLTQVNGRGYRGWIEVRKKQNGLLLVINDLDIEDYLKGVITSEVPSDWHAEALKAQAVASRTYALYEKRTAGNRAYHILATVKSQVYNGGSGEQSSGLRAVRETAGLIIAYRGEIIPAFYHSSCGGQTENAGELWGIDEPYLRGVDCECQEAIRDGLWEKRISTVRIAEALRRQGLRLGDILGMDIKGITPAGRVKNVVIRDQSGEKLVPAERFRAAVGNTLVPSVFFELEMSEGEAVFSGRGNGHGVGLCQWGAEEMAESGRDFKFILSHYYPGTSLVRME
jgi:stage II sporulation protein D